MSELKTTHKYNLGQVVHTSWNSQGLYKVIGRTMRIDARTAENYTVTLDPESNCIEYDLKAAEKYGMEMGANIVKVRSGFEFGYNEDSPVSEIKADRVYTFGAAADHKPALIKISTVSISPVYMLVEVNANGDRIGIGYYDCTPESSIVPRLQN